MGVECPKARSFLVALTHGTAPETDQIDGHAAGAGVRLLVMFRAFHRTSEVSPQHVCGTADPCDST